MEATDAARSAAPLQDYDVLQQLRRLHVANAFLIQATRPDLK